MSRNDFGLGELGAGGAGLGQFRLRGLGLLFGLGDLGLPVIVAGDLSGEFAVVVGIRDGVEVPPDQRTERGAVEGGLMGAGEAFGEAMLAADGSLDRAAMRALAFQAMCRGGSPGRYSRK